MARVMAVISGLRLRLVVVIGHVDGGAGRVDRRRHGDGIVPPGYDALNEGEFLPTRAAHGALIEEEDDLLAVELAHGYRATERGSELQENLRCRFADKPSPPSATQSTSRLIAKRRRSGATCAYPQHVEPYIAAPLGQDRDVVAFEYACRWAVTSVLPPICCIGRRSHECSAWQLGVSPSDRARTTPR
jgi:hypothetical protein